jgi:hypothetical protein
MDNLISQFEKFQQSVAVVETMLGTCKNQMFSMERHLLGMAAAPEEKGNQ